MGGDGVRPIALILVLAVAIGMAIYNHFTGNDTQAYLYDALTPVSQVATE